MIINKTEEEKRSDIVSHTKKSMSVEAGAGAGKTTLIVRRNVEQIKSGEVTADGLVDITFTNAAAEELRDRLMTKLHEVVLDPNNTEEEQRNLENAIKDESMIQISTIHSFCKRLLTEQSFAAKIPLDVTLLDNVQADERKKQIFEDWFNNQMDKSEFQRLNHELSGDDAGEFLLGTFMSICDLPGDTNFKYGLNSAFTRGWDFNRYVSEINQQIDSMLNAALVIAQGKYPGLNFSTFEDVAKYQNDKGTRKIVKADYVKLDTVKRSNPLVEELISAYKSCWEDADKEKEWLGKTLKLAFSGQTCKDLAWTKEDAEELNALYENQVSTYEYLADYLEVYQSELIIDLAIKARDYYRQVCKSASMRREITNDALLQETLELVRENKEARNYFQSKFSCIYVDEFQDTDVVQRDLIEYLCMDPNDESKRREGVFFYVGDPKQSIYAFRGADVEVYADTRNKYLSDDVTDVEVYTLDKNYRSEKPVVDWVNSNFATKFSSILPAGYSNMEANKDHADSTEIIRGIYTLDHPVYYSSEDKKADKTIKNTTNEIYGGKANELESDMLLAIIQHLMNLAKDNQDDEDPEGQDQEEQGQEEQNQEDKSQEEQSQEEQNQEDKSQEEQNQEEHTQEDTIEFKIWKPEKNSEGKEEWNPKPIQYKDFLILCGKKKDINIYANKLKKAGIPVNLYGALSMNEEDVIVRSYQLYHYLSYPMDKMAKYGAMEVLLNSQVTKENVQEGKRRIDALKQRTKNMSGIEALQYLAHHLEYLLAEKVTREEVDKSYSRLQQLLEAIIVQNVGDYKDIDSAILKYMDSDVDKELALEKNADAVRFMNLHKAKGLEGSIVIIASRKQRKSKKEAYRSMKDFYPVAIAGEGNFKIIKKGYTFLNDAVSNKPILELVIQKEKAEWIRQEYVEATRGKQAVIFMDALDGNSVFSGYDLATGTKNLLDISDRLRADVNRALEGRYKISSASENNYNYSMNGWDSDLKKEQKFHQRHSITPSGMEKNDRNVWQPGEENNRPKGNIFGLVMHRAFELLVNKIRNRISYNVDKIIVRAIMENVQEIVVDYVDSKDKDIAIKQYKDYLAGRLNAFLSDQKLIDEIIHAKAVYTEMGFAMFAKQEEFEQVNDSLYSTMLSRFGLDENEPYWVNGQADLVIQLENDNVKIIDYKSDSKGQKTIEELEDHLHVAYDNQQELYRYMISKSLDIPIEKISYQYYHMYKG